MTQRTRYFLFGSALVLVVSLATGLVAFYNGSLPLRKSTVGPAELAYIGPDAAAIVYADVRGIMGSEFKQRLNEVLPDGTEREKLHAEIGIDIERDVDTVVAAMTGTDHHGAVVLVRGRFDTNRIEATAVSHGARVEDYKGKKLVIMMADHAVAPTVEGAGAPATSSTGGGVAFLEPGLLALGETAAIKRAIDVGEAGNSVTKSEDFMRHVAAMDQRSSAWVVGRFDAIAKSADVPQEFKAHLPAVEWFAMNAFIDGGVRGLVRAEARDEKAGEQLRDVVRGGLAAAQLVSGQDPQIDLMVKSVQVAGAGKEMSLTFAVPKEVLDKLAGLADSLHGAPGARDAVKDGLKDAIRK